MHGNYLTFSIKDEPSPQHIELGREGIFRTWAWECNRLLLSRRSFDPVIYVPVKVWYRIYKNRFNRHAARDVLRDIGLGFRVGSAFQHYSAIFELQDYDDETTGQFIHGIICPVYEEDNKFPSEFDCWYETGERFHFIYELGYVFS